MIAMAAAFDSAYVSRVCAIGDSIAWGVGATALSAWMEPLLNTMVAAGIPFKPVGNQTYGTGALVSLGPCNFGFPGAAIRNNGSTQSLQTLAYPYVASYQPDLVILQAGTNDLGILGDNAATVLASMSSELDTIWAALDNPRARIVRFNLLQRYDGVDVTGVNAGLAAMIAGKSYASHVSVADIYSAAPYPADHASSDQVHPNDAGYTAIAAAATTPVQAALQVLRS